MENNVNHLSDEDKKELLKNIEIAKSLMKNGTKLIKENQENLDEGNSDEMQKTKK